jgi:hypothetical protein
VNSRTLHTLLHTIVDYAGLFPPAGLNMDSALALYTSYHGSTHAWMLGRFIVPVDRLDEMVHSMQVVGSADDSPWRLSVLMGEKPEGDVAAILAFNEARHQGMVDALEARATTAAGIRDIARIVPHGIRAYVEIPVNDDPQPLIAALAEHKLRAKIRTGGVVPSAIPSVEEVARFLRACYAAGVPFKATAGLHHPLRSEHPLTYETDAPRAVMHGFLNVFLAAVLHYNGLTARDTIDLLNMQQLDDIVMDDEKIAWRDYVVSVAEVTTIRRRHAIAFGSCSFTEPVEDLVKLGLLT